MVNEQARVEPLAGVTATGLVARARAEGKRIGRPPGSRDRHKRRPSGYFARWAREREGAGTRPTSDPKLRPRVNKGSPDPALQPN